MKVTVCKPKGLSAGHKCFQRVFRGILQLDFFEATSSMSERITCTSPLLKSPPTQSPLQFHRIAIHRLLNSPPLHYTADKLHRLVNLCHDEFSASQHTAAQSGHVVRWVASWLKGRKQRGCLDGYSLTWADVLSGIPQGSVLGPLLFLIFINDLEDDIMSLVLKFADDTNIFRKVSNTADGLQLQRDLNRLCD